MRAIRIRAIALLVTLAAAGFGSASVSTDLRYRYCNCFEEWWAFSQILQECAQLDDNPPPYHCGDFSGAGECTVIEEPYEINYNYYCYEQQTQCTQWIWEEWQQAYCPSPS